MKRIESKARNIKYFLYTFSGQNRKLRTQNVKKWDLHKKILLPGQGCKLMFEKINIQNFNIKDKKYLEASDFNFV